MNMKTFLLLASLAALQPPTEVSAESPETGKAWSVSVGAGLILAPTYLGDDAYQLSAVPNIRATFGDDAFASIEGVGYNLINTRGWRGGAIVAYNFGRDDDGDSPFVIAGDDTDDLQGLGDVDGTIEIGGFLEYSAHPITTSIEIRQGVNGHEGLIGEAEIRYSGRVIIADRMMLLSIGPSITLVDQNYNDAFFGVDAEQSAASGLDEFDADGGLLSYSLGGSFIFPIDDRISLVAITRYERLAGDAADSSLVEDRGSADQATIGVFLNYTF